MSFTNNLGDTLYSYIRKGGYSIYEISKKANVSRSMLQKVLSNERKLTKNYLDKLKPFLKISPREYMDLISMTEEIQKGTFEYQSYQQIKNLLSGVTDAAEIQKAPEHYTAVSVGSMEKRDLYVGRAAVEGLLQESMRREYQKTSPWMHVFIPGGSNLVSQVLTRESLMNPDCETLMIKQVISLARDKSNAETVWFNVNTLFHVLPNLIIEKNHYQVFYYYGKEYSEVKGEFAFPYYILFSDAVIFLSADSSTAILHTEEAVCEHFSNVFHSLLSNTFPLVTSCVAVDNILGHVIEADKSGHGIYSLENQPCLAAYLTEDIIRKYAETSMPNYDAAVAALMARANQLSKYKQHGHTCFFSKAGLLYFAKEGVILDFPKEYAKPIGPKDRIRLLEALYEEINSGRQSHRMVNPYRFPIPDHLICVFHQNVGMDFYGFGRVKKSLDYIYITEQSVMDIFNGFFQYLKDSMLVFSKEETLDCISQCMDQLSQGLIQGE